MEKRHVLYSRLISHAEDHDKTFILTSSVDMDNQIALCNMQNI